MKDIGQNTFYKKFSDISVKLTNNLLSAKMNSRPDYIDVFLGLINRTNELGRNILI